MSIRGVLRLRSRTFAQTRNVGLLCSSLRVSDGSRVGRDVYGRLEVEKRRDYSIFRKKPVKWEKDNSIRRSEDYNQVVRRLREELAGGGNDEEIKRLIFQVIEKEGDLKGVIELIEKGLQRLLRGGNKVNVEDIQLIYRGLLAMNWKESEGGEGEGESEGKDNNENENGGRGWLLKSPISQTKTNIITKLYSELYNERMNLSAGDSLENGVLYIKYLRSEGLIVESRKLLQALLLDARVMGVVDEDMVLKLIDMIKSINPDVDSLVVLFDLIGNSKLFSLSLFHEGILSFTEIAGQDDNQQLMRLLNVLFNKKFDLSEETIIIVLDCCLSLNSVECGKRILRVIKPRVEEMLKEVGDGNDESQLQFFELLLMSCSKFGEDISFGNKIYDKIMSYSNLMVKESWDTVVQWISYKANNVIELEEVLDEMIIQNFNPNEITLNLIISNAVGIGKKNNKFIDSIVELFDLKYDVECNVETYSLLIERKLQSIDHEAALKLFEVSIKNGCDWSDKNLSTLDDLLISLCNNPSITQVQIFQLYQQILMFTQKIGYKAQIELLKMFLSIGNSYDVELFLTEQFGQRPGLPYQKYLEIYQILFDSVISCKDHKLAWELYGLLNGLIKLPFESYYPVMQLFCKLGRPDAGLLILKYLRARSRKEGIQSPNRAMYILLFNEFGASLYEEGIQELQTLLRTDLYTEVDIEIMNSILGAYCNLQDIHRTKETWLEINGFPKELGVNNETITIMIKHLTRFSLEEVEKLWTSFTKTYSLTPNSDNLRQYIIANCYNGYYMRALEITKRSKEIYGIEPTQDIIQALYNWTMLDSRKSLIEKWAIESHPTIWTTLQENNLLKTYTLPDNVDNDSEENLRAKTIEQIENSELGLTNIK